MTHPLAGQVGTIRLRKIDGGYRAVAVNDSHRGLWSEGDELFNRQFHPFKKGEEFHAVIKISEAGRKMVQEVESLTGAALPPKPTRSKRAPKVEAQAAVSSGFPALEEVDPAFAAKEKAWHERQRKGNTLVEVLGKEEGISITADAKPLVGGIQEMVEKMAAASEVAPVVVDIPEKQMTQTVPLKVEKKPEPKVTDGYYIAPDMRLAFNKVYRMSLNKPERAVKVMMVGPSGYGKSTMPQLFAASVGYTYMRMDCAKVRDPEEWFGYREAIDGTTVFIKSNFAKALERGNLVVTMDEFNRLEPWIHNSLFPMLDDAGRTVVHDEEFRIGPNVVVVGTINIGYKYTGTFELDEALLNRFDFFLEVGPMEHREEVEVLVKRTGVAKRDAEELVRMANRLRTQEVVCSTRTTLQVAEKVAAGMTLRQAYEYTVVRRIPQDNTGSSLRKAVVDSINTHLGAFEIEAIEGDVFEMGAKGAEVSAVKEVTTRHYIKLHATSSAIGMMHLIGAIRKLPLVKPVTPKEAQRLAESVREGAGIELELFEKPDNFEQLVANFKSMGVGGNYRSVRV